MFKRMFAVVVFCTFSLFFLSCKDDKVRQYTETGSNVSQDQKMLVPSTIPERGHLLWESPEGWDIKESQSRIRQATFLIGTGDKQAVCTIITLSGDGGGLKPNITRWLGQLNVTMESEGKLDQFVAKQTSFQTVGKLPAILIDFIPLTPGPDDVSMLVSITTLKESTVYIKMTGPKSTLSESRDKFVSLSKSIRLGS